MSSSGSHRQSDSDGREVRYSDDRGDIETHIDKSSLLDEVLSQTAAASRTKDLRADPTLRLFLDVARRHQGKPFVLDPVAIDLVAAALQFEFRGRILSPEFRDRMSVDVARTIFEDPVCHDRLQTFWNRLISVLS